MAVMSMLSGRKISQLARSAAARDAEEQIPGYIQCEWLLQDFRNTVTSDIRQLMRKGEEDLMRMARKVIIHSRVLAPGGLREGEQGPGGTMTDAERKWAMARQYSMNVAREAEWDNQWDDSARMTEPSRKVRRPH